MQRIRGTWFWLVVLAACGEGERMVEDGRIASAPLVAEEPPAKEYLWDCAAIARDSREPMYDVPCSCAGEDANGKDVEWETVHERYLTEVCAPEDDLLGGAPEALNQFSRQCKVHCGITAPANVVMLGLALADPAVVWATCTLRSDAEGNLVPC